MDRMRAEGAGQKMAGKAKEAAGKLTGDNKLKAEGRADQVTGSVKNAVGSAKDSMKDAGRKLRR